MRARLSLVARRYGLDRSLITMIEGKISEIRERIGRADCAAILGRPVDVVADAAGVSRSTVQRWIRDARRAESRRADDARGELLRDFLDSFDALCRASVAPLERSMITIASDPKHARCVDAAKWLAPRLDPIGEEHREGGHGEREPTVADIPQAALDALTPEERARLAELDAAIDALNGEVDRLLLAGAARAGVDQGQVMDALASI